MDVVKVGIIGCGWFGNRHLDNLLKLEGVQITVLVSTNKEKLTSTAKKVPEARLYQDYRDLFREEKELDAVILCVPPDSHGDAELLAAARGIHLYIEKPVELSMERAIEIQSVIQKAGVISSCGYHERYNPGAEEARQYIAARQTGLATGIWLGDVPGAAWWRRKKRSGGQLVEQDTHIVDLLRYYFGEAKTVYCTATTGLVTDIPNYDVNDASVAVIHFENGVVATMQTGCYLQSNVKNRVGLQVYCKDSTLEYDWMEEFRYISNEGTRKVPAHFDTHFFAIQTFIQAVKTGNADLVRSPYADAIKTLALTLAANESMESGLSVDPSKYFQ